MVKGSWKIFDDILSHLEEGDLRQIGGKIIVQNSSNVEISNNTFTTNIYLNGMPYDTQPIEAKKIDIPFTEQISQDKMQRALLNNDYLDRFIFECNQKGICPTFRYYGLFSHISTLRSRSDYSEYNQLILEEKHLFDRMIELNYRIRLIISLDIPIIITKWGYTIEEVKARISNLCDNIDIAAKDHNIEIVIDQKNSMDSLYICDRCLLIKAANIDPVKKYNITRYITNRFEIDNCIKEFDQKFQYLKYLNQCTREMTHSSSYSSLIRTIIQNRMEEYYNLLNTGGI